MTRPVLAIFREVVFGCPYTGLQLGFFRVLCAPTSVLSVLISLTFDSRLAPSELVSPRTFAYSASLRYLFCFLLLQLSKITCAIACVGV